MKKKICILLNSLLAFSMLTAFNSCGDDDPITTVTSNVAGSFTIQDPSTGENLLKNDGLSLFVDDSVKIVFHPNDEYKKEGITFTTACSKLLKVEGTQDLYVARKSSDLNVGYNALTVDASFQGKIGSINYNLSASHAFILTLSEVTFSVSANELRLAANGKEISKIMVESNVPWTATSNASWLNVVKRESDGKSYLEIFAEDNTNANIRSGIITVSAHKGQQKQEISVTQEAQNVSVLYKEPYTVWGASVSQTKNYMSDYVLYSEEATMLSYIGNDKEALIAYMFDNGKLYTSAVAIRAIYATIDEISDQLTRNGYIYIGNSSSSNLPMFVSGDQKTGVSISENNNTYYIYYMDLNHDSGSTPISSETLFEDPYTNWGASHSTVKSIMSGRGYNLIQESTSASENYYLSYEGKYEEMLSMYMFNDENKLDKISIVLLASVASVTRTGEYLTSKLGYSYLSTSSSGDIGYVSSDYGTIVLVSSSVLSGKSVTMVTFADVNSLMGTRQLSGLERAKACVSMLNSQQNTKLMKSSFLKTQCDKAKRSIPKTIFNLPLPQ